MERIQSPEIISHTGSHKIFPPVQFSGERKVFSINVAGSTGNPYETGNLGPLLYTIQKNYFEMNPRPKCER